METFKLLRTGKPELEIEAEKVKEWSTRVIGKGYAESRWHDVDLYRDEEGELFAHVTYYSQYSPPERGLSVVMEAESPEVLIEQLQAFDPTAEAQGRPERSDQERAVNGPRNKELKLSLRSRWDEVVVECAQLLGVTEKRKKKGAWGGYREGGGRHDHAIAPGEATKSVGTRLTLSRIAEMDEARGDQERADFIRDAIEAHITTRAALKKR